jgi:hypothetical protein
MLHIWVNTHRFAGISAATAAEKKRPGVINPGALSLQDEA